MSWQDYIDTSLLGTGHADAAAIFDKDGASNWSRSPNFKISPEEIKAIVGSYTDPSKVLAEGFKVDGAKYMTVKTPDGGEGVLVGKKGKEGFAVAQTKQALILAHHGEEGITQSLVTVVENLKDYLVGVGY